MSFEDILNMWENGIEKSNSNKVKKITKNNDMHNMDSFLDLYPPVEGSGEPEAEKLTPRQKKRNYRRMKPQETLDLHGYTIISAMIELEDFIIRCRKRKIEKILIIHGKGLHSPEGEAVLRVAVRDKLKASPFIGEIGHPSEMEGGAGATWAIIKF